MSFCYRCGSRLVEGWRFCNNCGSQISNYESPHNERQDIVLQLRELYVVFQHSLKLKETIISIQARKNTYAVYFGRFMAGGILVAIVLPSIIWSIFPSLGFDVYWMGLPFVVGGVILGLLLSRRLCQENEKAINLELAEPMRALTASFNRVEQLIGLVPPAYREPQYIKYLADLLESRRASSMYEATQFLQWEIDRPARERKEAEERYLKEVAYLYYSEPHYTIRRNRR